MGLSSNTLTLNTTDMCNINKHNVIIRCVNAAELYLATARHLDTNYTDRDFEAAANVAVNVVGDNATEEEKNKLKHAVIRELESRHTTILTGGGMLPGKNCKSWLTPERKEALLTNNFWNAYKEYKEDDLGPATAEKIDEETDEILGYMADPQVMTPQRKMGLVIGDVQSGKTANYAGLICKAADAGYKVIIVIAGIINSLRNQTQERLERDFVGRSSRPDKAAGGCYGVSCYWSAERKPAFPVQLLTQYIRDFNAGDAGQVRPDFEHDSIALLVIKKNSNSLRNVYEYFSNRLNQAQRDKLPLLLLDDEADNASPNTRADEDSTTINRNIRELLSLFSRHSYVGYTATPYANIFINPFVNEDSLNDGMAGQDLFPKDFIKCLSRSSKYIGATRLFDPENDDSADGSNELEFNVCTIDDEPEYLEELKRGNDPGMIPKSMEEAIKTFVLTKALRLMRDGYDRHCTMMIHVTMRQTGHEIIRNHVRAYWRQLQEAIKSYIGLPEPEHRDVMLEALKQTWDEQFERTNVTETWKDVCAEMSKNGYTEKFMVLMENANVPRNDAAPYNEDLRLVYHDKEPLTAIVVGGNSLARGLTLEGLCTSYFLRNSQQYDTLMQMGRWFGYRGNYADLCRIFLTGRMQANFAEIALATEELKESVAVMSTDGKTPMEFGLRVRNSVGGLLITSRNKMRSAEQREVWVDFSDSLLETYRVPATTELVESNRKVMCDFIRDLDDKYTRYDPTDKQDDETHYGIIWENVPGIMVANYLGRFSDMSFSSDPYVLGTLMKHLKEGKMDNLDVVLIAGDDVQSTNVREINGIKYHVPFRVPNVVDGYYFFAKNHPFAKNHETGHVKNKEVDRLCELYMAEHPNRKSVKRISRSELPGRYFRRAAERRPLMMLALMAVPAPNDALNILAARRQNRQEKKESDATAESLRCTSTVAVYGFSFPKGAGTLQRVKYTVNSVELKRQREETERMEAAEIGERE